MIDNFVDFNDTSYLRSIQDEEIEHLFTDMPSDFFGLDYFGEDLSEDILYYSVNGDIVPMDRLDEYCIEQSVTIKNTNPYACIEALEHSGYTVDDWIIDDTE
ncbi:hypothetical protein [Ligilactobacillus salivarius]|uniref:Uncharacterized protein n=1 Tax=Ligilactobacillus salivarius TaxID=1624 RepID=A0A9X6XLX2_9LACO|nr:hypothetical protein [Ligilactobacillus salivarius]OTF89787.1 hypothetical protein A8C38_00485 [Ligilactobacillus salivarius]PAY43017.1 hypothetical protein A8C52_11540 [Ligilactobacillus salivarius]PAY43621.1 hypothetical protein A8C39_00665 [Ligilactobacillus salivarius]PAY49435.1 hypothetical protein A8C42_00810 [Ligilactobacillus salivarius]PAY54785.1 hypothetical protein A8C41_06605 [Ligilactobacillus salivarius]